MKITKDNYFNTTNKIVKFIDTKNDVILLCKITGYDADFIYMERLKNIKGYIDSDILKIDVRRVAENEIKVSKKQYYIIYDMANQYPEYLIWFKI